jgi:Sec-independent protein translocase protein TatA
MKKTLIYLLVTFVYFIFFLIMVVLLMVTFQVKKLPFLIKSLNKLTEYAKKMIYEKN